MGRPRTKSPKWLPLRCYPHGGQYVYKPLVGKTIPLGPKSDPGLCLAKYAELVNNKEAPGKKTVGDGLERYLREVVPKLAEGSQETYRLYVAKLKHGLGEMCPNDVTIDHLYEYHEIRSQKAATRANREITVLGVVYQHMIKWRYARTNPTIGFLFAEEKVRERNVSLREIRKFGKMAPQWLRVYALLKLLTGLRQRDLLQLGDLSVDHSRGLLRTALAKKRVGQTKIREYRLTWALRIAIRAAQALPRPKTQTLWFVSQKGKTRGQALSQMGFKSAWKRAQTQWVANGGTAFWEHDIRAQAANQADRREASQLLGHEDSRVTRKHYLRGPQRVRPLR